MDKSVTFLENQKSMYWSTSELRLTLTLVPLSKFMLTVKI